MRLADFYREHFRICDEALLGEILKVSRVRTLAAGEILCKQGQVPMQLYLLIQGVIRGSAEHKRKRYYRLYCFPGRGCGYAGW